MKNVNVLGNMSWINFQFICKSIFVNGYKLVGILLLKIIPDTSPAGIKIRMKTLETVIMAPEGVPLETMLVVVAGGAGAGDLEG